MYIAPYVIDITALFCLTGFLYFSTTMKAKRKKPFLIGTILTLIVFLSEVGRGIAGPEYVNFRTVNVLCNVLIYALSPMIPVAITLTLGAKIFKTQPLLLLPTLINVVAAVLSPRFGFVFHIDAGNQLFRGDYHFIFVTVFIINLLLLVFGTLALGKRHNYPIKRKLAMLFLFIIIGTSFQLAASSVYSSWHCVTLSLFLYFFMISEFDSSFDTLTGFYNRASFDKATRKIQDGEKFSLIILDINDFKKVNDTHGHKYGDAIIKKVARVIRKSFNADYICYRIGGDEFSIISRVTDRGKIESQLKILTDNLIKLRKKGNLLPTVSYGFSIYRGGEKLDFHKIFKEADAQMYHYKKAYKADVFSKMNYPN